MTTIRPLTTPAECTQCEAIQQAAWQIPDREITPSHQLVANIHAGGLVLGAFDGDQVIGFVYSFFSRDEEYPLHHWSHQLAVLPDYEGQGIGTALKLAQREALLGRGITLVRWTFDPMMALNAHFSLHKLGVIARRFKRNAYGEMGGINAGLPTDRLIAEWHLARYQGQRRALTASMWQKAGAAVITPSQADIPPDAHALLVTIPMNWPDIKQADQQAARGWLMHIRRTFEAAFDGGYAVSDFITGQEHGYHLLLKADAISA